jgi:cell division inhibitor SepF
LYKKRNYVKINLYLRIGDDIMALSKFKKMLVDEDYDDEEEIEEEKANHSTPTSDSGKMILLEPRAYSESQQIADHLKKKNTVVVNMKRVTPDQAKRIVDFLSGTVYALGGDLQKIGGGIFLCTPKNVNVEGAISDDDDKSKKSKNDIDLEW